MLLIVYCVNRVYFLLLLVLYYCLLLLSLFCLIQECLTYRNIFPACLANSDLARSIDSNRARARIFLFVFLN